VQINIQIYVFNSDMHCKSAFCFLKIITHLYHFIAQMQSLCWDCVNVCNAFFVLFSSLISLIFVILCYCDAIACWNHCEEKNASSASWLYLYFSWMKTFRSTIFLMMSEWEMMWLTFVRQTHISLHIYWKYVAYVACNIHKTWFLCWFFS